MHRHDQAGAERPDDVRGPLAADRRAVTDGHEEDVDLADRRLLLGPQGGLAEVAQVGHPQAVEGEHEDAVRAALGAGRVVVLRGDGHELAELGVERAGRRADDLGRAADRLDPVVVAVLVGHQQDVGLDVPDGRVVEAQAARRERAAVHREGVDEHPLRPVEQEGGLAEPADAHQATSSRMTSSGRVAGCDSAVSGSVQWYLPPRRSEAKAASRQAAMANENA